MPLTCGSNFLSEAPVFFDAQTIEGPVIPVIRRNNSTPLGGIEIYIPSVYTLPRASLID